MLFRVLALDDDGYQNGDDRKHGKDYCEEHNPIDALRQCLKSTDVNGTRHAAEPEGLSSGNKGTLYRRGRTLNVSKSKDKH